MAEHHVKKMAGASCSRLLICTNWPKRDFVPAFIRLASLPFACAWGLCSVVWALGAVCVSSKLEERWNSGGLTS